MDAEMGWESFGEKKILLTCNLVQTREVNDLQA